MEEDELILLHFICYNITKEYSSEKDNNGYELRDSFSYKIKSYQKD